MSNPAPNGIIPEFTLGDRLRKARELAGLTPEQMGAEIGFTDRTIRNYETDNTPIKRGAAITWALRTGVSFDWLWNGEEPPNDPLTDRRRSRRRVIPHLQAA